MTRFSFLLLSSLLFFLFALQPPCTAQSFPGMAPNQLTVTPSAKAVSFQWNGDSVGGRWEPHAVLLVPVSLPGGPGNLFLQFDLGSPYTLFYKEALARVQEKKPTVVTTEPNATKLTNVRFSVGPVAITAKEVALRAMGTPKATVKKAPLVIGTLGADAIEGQVLVIDYVNQRLYINADVPEALAATPLLPFMFTNRSVLLPAAVAGKKTVLFFDTGSSAFSLLTDQKTADGLAIPGSSEEVYPVRSWDRILKAHVRPTRDSIAVGGATLPMHKVTYMEGASDSQIGQMLKLGIGGMTGNKLFVESTLILDTRTKKMGVVPAVKTRRR